MRRCSSSPRSCALRPADNDQRALKARAEQAFQDLAQARWAGFEAAAG
jgi:hypothetical protein